MKKKRSGEPVGKKIGPMVIYQPREDAECKKCGDTGLCPDVDSEGYEGFHFCNCPQGILTSKKYERGKCPLCKNGNFATRWKCSSTNPTRKEYRQVRCPHFHKL